MVFENWLYLAKYDLMIFEMAWSADGLENDQGKCWMLVKLSYCLTLMQTYMDVPFSQHSTRFTWECVSLILQLVCLSVDWRWPYYVSQTVEEKRNANAFSPCLVTKERKGRQSWFRIVHESHPSQSLSICPILRLVSLINHSSQFHSVLLRERTRSWCPIVPSCCLIRYVVVLLQRAGKTSSILLVTLHM